MLFTRTSIFLLIQVACIYKPSLSIFHYPGLQNIALNKRVELEPKNLICGIDSKISLCDNRLDIGKSCNQFRTAVLYCDQSCPYGTVIRNYNYIEKINLQKLNPCVTADRAYFVKTSPIKYSYLFSSNLCNEEQNFNWTPFILNEIANSLFGQRSLSVFHENENEGFTILFWFQQFGNRNGTIAHFVAEKNNTIFKLKINSVKQKIYLNYAFNKDVLVIDLKNKVVFNRWSSLAIKIYKNQLNVFINEPKTISDMPTVETIYLKMNLGKYLNSNSPKINAYFGINNQGKDIFTGWIQDLIVLAVPLSNREIYFKFNSSKSQDVRLQSECKCPNDFSRNENEFSQYCIRNDEINFDQKNVSYLNDFAHPLEYINDEKFETSWISSTLPVMDSADNSAQPIKISLDFENGVYILNRIELYFTSIPPIEILIETNYENQWRILQKYSTSCNTNEKSCRKLPSKLNKTPSKGFTIIWSVYLLYNQNNSNIEYEEFLKVQMMNKTFISSIKASKIRVTLKGFYKDIKNDIRKLYYSISEIKVYASCDCNGFSQTCDTTVNPYKCDCANTSFTGGNRCEECLPFYNNREYKTRYDDSNYKCDTCNCNGKANICKYDESIKKGICQNCVNNTEGNNCESCKLNYYYDNIQRTCQKCFCNQHGILNIKPDDQICDSEGRCICKQNIEGIKCDRCKPGFYNLTALNPFGCTKCNCNQFGSISDTNDALLCNDQTGQCNCKNKNIIGVRCDRCVSSYYNLSNSCLNSCGCDPYGSVNPYCDQFSGECLCKKNVVGRKCMTCAPGYFNLTFSGCSNECQCNPAGSLDAYCNPTNGYCKCKDGYTGSFCEKCSDSYYKVESSMCQKCSCNPYGTLNAGNFCNKETGKCNCNDNAEGVNCDKCKPGYWGINYGCKKCDCDLSGLENDYSIDYSDLSATQKTVLCDTVSGQCKCKEFRDGQRCDICIVGFFLVKVGDVDCLKCGCDPVGTVAGTFCDKFTGECVCKSYNGIGGTRCNECQPGYHSFSTLTGSCLRCDCNPAGSLNNECDKQTGQCECKSFATGLKCNVCVQSTSNLNINNPFGCSKKPTQQPPPTIKQINGSAIQVSWTLPDYPNGVITYYLLRRNGIILANSVSGRTLYIDNDILPFNEYSYTIEAFNDQGSALSKPSFILTSSGRPCCKFYFDTLIINSRRVVLKWSLPERLNGINPIFYLNLNHKPFNHLEKNESISLGISYKSLLNDDLIQNNEVIYTINELLPYSEYSIYIKACNQESSATNCLVGLSNSSNITPSNAIIFYTQQDKPELQQTPTIIGVNSTFASLAITKPLIPNGVILLYEVWLKNLNKLSLALSKADNNIGYLVCAVEEWYDPHGLNATIALNETKMCIIKDLKPFSLYSVVVSSSTIVGHSEFSSELKFLTAEDRPLCAPKFVSAFSNSSNSIYLSWDPSQLTTNNSWIECVRGNIKEFQLSIEINGTFKLIYSGPLNQYLVTRLIPLRKYAFKIALCNKIGCIESKTSVTVTTKIAPPGKNQPSPYFKPLNSSFIKFQWDENVNENDKDENELSLRYRLERSTISFAYPPTILESGIRFHGLNYFNFPTASFPDGYSFFGIKFSLRTSQESGLIYFAGSSDAQDEFSSVQFSDGLPSFLSNTQADSDPCFVSLSTRNTIRFFNDDNWYNILAVRVQNYVYLQSDSEKNFKNASSCANDVIDGVTGVYIGGIPLKFLKLDETKFNSFNIGKIKRNNFIGCLRNVTSIVNYTANGIESSYTLKNFDFSNLTFNQGEPVRTNTWNGCPRDLDMENNPIYFLGYGFIKIRYLDDVYNSLESIEFEFRTEVSEGLLFFAYDPINYDFLMINLLNSSAINVKMSYRVSATSETQGKYLNLIYENMYNISNLNNGYWTKVKVVLNIKKTRFSLSINETQTITDTILSDTEIRNLTANGTLSIELFIYLSAGHFFGGIDFEEVRVIIGYYSDRGVAGFKLIYDYFYSIASYIYFSGCIRKVKVSGLNVIPTDTSIFEIVKYIHVRLDGCPSFKKFQNSMKIQNFIETIYDGNQTTAYDTDFHSSTEYFYRIVAYNSEGTASSNWILLRTPDTSPLFSVDNSFVTFRIINGYNLLVTNTSYYCFYCSSKQDSNEVFTGIVTSFEFIIKVYNASIKRSSKVKSQLFFCDDICLNGGSSNYKNIYGDIETIMNNNQNNSVDYDITVETIPMEKYLIEVEVCTNGGCVNSLPKEVITPQETPAYVNPPYLYSKSSTFLHLKWPQPTYPNGNITGYVLKLANSIIIKPIYIGLMREYKFEDLEPFTSYTFFLDACNKIGCNSSKNSTFITAEMPPQSVQTPEIFGVNQDSFLVRWIRPTSIEIQSGIIRYYLLYVQEVEDPLVNRTLISSVHNVSSCSYCSFLIQNVLNLTAGTVYKTKLSVCTGGGCKNSTPILVTTLESTPDVSDVVIYAAEKTSTSLRISWNRPSYPNGKISSYKLYLDSDLIYDGLDTSYLVHKLKPYTFYEVYLIMCNNVSCNPTKRYSIQSDESQPEGYILLEAQAIGERQITLKWSILNDKTPFIPNGKIFYLVFVEGPYINENNINNNTLIENYKREYFVENQRYNLLNATKMNIKYGIMGRILPFSEYYIQVNASNTRGYILSNKIKVFTPRSKPDYALPPILLRATSKSLRLKWWPPVLINSEDTQFFFQIEFRKIVRTTPDILIDSRIEGVFENSTVVVEHTVENLVPYSGYIFRLIVANSYGSDTSDWSDYVFTKEELPGGQKPPDILHFNSTFAFLEWDPPKHPNGIVTLYRIIVLKISSAIKKPTAIYELNNTNSDLSYLVPNLIPFTQYLFAIESCNSIGCVSSLAGNDKNSNFIKTLPAKPDMCLEPSLSSLNSYTVLVKWQPPLKENGIISSYIIERLDFKPGFRETINSESVKDIKRYRFQPDRFNFSNYDDIDPCGSYGFRLIAINQLGNCSSKWNSITTQPAKPAVVYTPKIRIVNSTTAVFTWVKPVTYCSITSYILSFDAINDLGFNYRMEENITESIMIKSFFPFTNYTVKLIACVDSKKIECIESTSQNFRTPGSVPSKVYKPKTRLVRSNVILIVWFEPLLKNGPNLAYQLIRKEIYGSKSGNNSEIEDFDKPTIVYIGNQTFFIDKNLKVNSVYKYMVLCNNGFGHSLSEWSEEINTKLFSSPEIHELNKIFILFELKAKARSPTSISLKWKNYDNNELRNFLAALIHDRNKASNSENRIDISNSRITEASILISRISNVNLDKKKNVIKYNIRINKTDSEITHLYPESNYTFSLLFRFSSKDFNNSETPFLFISETVRSQTPSIHDIYSQGADISKQQKILKIFTLNQTFITVSYRLTNILMNSYKYYRIKLDDKILNSFNKTKFEKNLNKSDSFIYGPVKSNEMHVFYMEACHDIFDGPINTIEVFFKEDCVLLISENYSFSTKPPLNLSNLKIEILNSSAAEIKWQQPKYPNGYLSSFVLYRRSISPKSKYIDDKGICFEVRGNHVIINPFKNTSFDLSKMILKCGQQYYRVNKNFKCCANMYYIKVPIDQLCCPTNDEFINLKESHYKVGNGDNCCLDFPFYKKSTQKCCSNQVISKYKIAEKNDGGVSALKLKEEQCSEESYFDLEIKDTGEVKSLYMGLEKSFIDNTIIPNTYYQYKICAKNAFGTTCNRDWENTLSESQLFNNNNIIESEIINATQIALKWTPSLGYVEYYRIFRDNFEIYKGNSLQFIDGTSTEVSRKSQNSIQPFIVYEYSLSACNNKGCSNAGNSIFVTTKEKLPDLEKVHNWFYINSTCLNFTWFPPSQPNGIIEKFVIFIKESELEVEIYMDFKSVEKSAVIYAKNFSMLKNNYLNFESSLLEKSIVTYSVIICDLQPYNYYSLSFKYCNSIGCRHSKSSYTSDEYIKTQSPAYFPSNFKEIVIFLRDSGTCEITWQEPKAPNGQIVKYKIYRNDVLIKTLKLPSFNKSLNQFFYSYIDGNLQLQKYFSYRIEAENNDFLSISSPTVSVQTLDENLDDYCSSSSKVTHSIENPATLIIFKTLKLVFEVENSHEVLVSFNFGEWDRFFKCVFINSNISLFDSRNSSVFSSKLILYSELFGFQYIQFPLFTYNLLEEELNKTVKQRILGLKSDSKYSIRFQILTNYMKTQKIWTSESIQLQTHESRPCCKIDPPRVRKHRYYKKLIIRWNAPEFSNGKIIYYELNRTRLKGDGCNALKTNEINDNIEEISKISLINIEDGGLRSGLKYDSLNKELIYEDDDYQFLNRFTYYAYHVTAYNRNGKLESKWSKPVLIWQLKPTPPTEMTIRDIHSSGFTLKFKEPILYNGFVVVYKVIISSIGSERSTNSETNIKIVTNITFKADYYCKNSSSIPQISVPINGLQSYKSYRVTAVSVNIANIESDESEAIIGNTLESTPAKLTAFLYEIKKYKYNNTQTIYFKFKEPEVSNGVITNFNLYQTKIPKKLYKNKILLYKGLDREFVLHGLKPFTDYGFEYSVCTVAGCTVQYNETIIKTLESTPENQFQPKTKKSVDADCIDVSWTYPAKPNGVLKKFELYKRMIDKNSHLSEGSQIILINTIYDLSGENKENFYYRDCNLTSNIIYFYKVRIYNNAGYGESNYSEPIEIEKHQGNYFDELLVNQVNHTIISLVWPSINLIGETATYYQLFRNKSLIEIIKILSPSYGVNKYTDVYSFLPKTIYSYKIYTCKSKIYCNNQVLNSSILTKDQPPLNVEVPQIANLTSYVVLINMSNTANLLSETQSIIEYRLFLNDKIYYSGNESLVSIKNLLPFQNYSIVLEACTYFAQIVNNFLEKGCKYSPKLLFTSLQSVPENLDQIIFEPLKGTIYKAEVLIKWTKPDKENGILRLCELRRNNEKIFASKNMNITQFNDYQLNHGTFYKYELKYENDAGYISVKNIYTTEEMDPKLINSPTCKVLSSNQIRLNWTAPTYPNGIIRKYYVVYFKIYDKMKKLNETIVNSKNITDHENMYILKNLSPATEYGFRIVACNKKGCVYSSNETYAICKTYEAIPDGVFNPNCSQTLNHTYLMPVVIEWSLPKIPNGEIISYSLFKINMGEFSLKFDQILANNTKKLIYKGNKTKYIDFDVTPFNVYKYAIEAENSKGSTKSNWTRFYTNSIKPNILKDPGKLINLTNQSVTVAIDLPKQINGVITIIKVYLISKKAKDSFIIYSNSQKTSTLDDITKQTFINGLKNDTHYQLKSEVCNQVGCLESENVLKFKTLKTEKINNFEMLKLRSNNIELNWDFVYEPNPLFNNTNLLNISYELYVKSEGKNTLKRLVYKGVDKFVNLTDLEPYTNYSFELVAKRQTKSETSIVVSNLIVQTSVEKPVFIKLPVVKQTKIGENIENIKINWDGICKLNGPLVKYILYVNNETIYDGLNTEYINDFAFDCKNNLLKIGSELAINLESSFIFKLEVYTTEGFIQNDFYSIDYNCTIESFAQQSRSKNLIQEYWFIILLVLANLMIIIAIFTIILCLYARNRKREKSINEAIKHKIYETCESQPIVHIQKHLFQNINEDEKNKNLNNGSEDLSLAELLNYGSFFNDDKNSLSSRNVIKPKITRLDSLMANETRI